MRGFRALKITALAGCCLAAGCATDFSAPAIDSRVDSPDAGSQRMSSDRQVTGTRLRVPTQTGSGRLPVTSFPLVVHGADEIESTGTREVDEILRLINPYIY